MKNFILAAVAALSILNSCCQPSDPSQTVIDNIMTRTSVRQFTSQPVTDEQMQTILKAGMAAPSAVNKQPWRFVVLTDTALFHSLADSIRSARPASTAAAVIVVCADMEATLPAEARNYWVEDCSAATQNILLAAHGMGLGAVWLGGWPVPERGKLLRQMLDLPSNIEPFGMIALGYPAENPEPKDKWKPENVHYNKW